MAQSRQPREILVPLIPRAPGLTQLFSLISSFTVDQAFLRASGSTSRAGGNWGGLEKPVRERGRLNKEGNGERKKSKITVDDCFKMENNKVS